MNAALEDAAIAANQLFREFVDSAKKTAELEMRLGNLLTNIGGRLGVEGFQEWTTENFKPGHEIAIGFVIRAGKERKQ